MITLDTKVRLTAKARLRFDERSQRHILLYPERGLELSDSAARIIALCRQEVLVRDIVDAMAALAEDQPRERIESDVLDLLRSLADRGLLIVSRGRTDG